MGQVCRNSGAASGGTGERGRAASARDRLRRAKTPPPAQRQSRSPITSPEAHFCRGGPRGRPLTWGVPAIERMGGPWRAAEGTAVLRPWGSRSARRAVPGAPLAAPSCSLPPRPAHPSGSTRVITPCRVADAVRRAQPVHGLILAQPGRLVSPQSGFRAPSGAQSAQSRQPRPIVGRGDARRIDVRQLSPGAFRRRPENIPL